MITSSKPPVEIDDYEARVAKILGLDTDEPTGANSESLIVLSQNGRWVSLGARCGVCGGHGDFMDSSGQRAACAHCGGHGWFGIDPEMPVMADQGSVEKIAMLSVRYSTGVSLWNSEDGPKSDRSKPAATNDVQPSAAKKSMATARASQAVPNPLATTV